MIRYWSHLPYRLIRNGSWALMSDARMVRPLVERRSLYCWRNG